MFTVTTYTGNGTQIDEGECEPDAFHSTTRTLWRDSVEHKTGVTYAVVRDGERVVRMFNACP